MINREGRVLLRRVVAEEGRTRRGEVGAKLCSSRTNLINLATPIYVGVFGG